MYFPVALSGVVSPAGPLESPTADLLWTLAPTSCPFTLMDTEVFLAYPKAPDRQTSSEKTWLLPFFKKKFFLATPHSMQDLSSLTRDWTYASHGGSVVLTAGPSGKSMWWLSLSQSLPTLPQFPPCLLNSNKHSLCLFYFMFMHLFGFYWQCLCICLVSLPVEYKLWASWGQGLYLSWSLISVSGSVPGTE